MGRMWKYDIERLIELFNTGLTYNEIATELNRSYSAVKQQCNKLQAEGILEKRRN